MDPVSLGGKGRGRVLIGTYHGRIVHRNVETNIFIWVHYDELVEHFPEMTSALRWD